MNGLLGSPAQAGMLPGAGGAEALAQVDPLTAVEAAKAWQDFAATPDVTTTAPAARPRPTPTRSVSPGATGAGLAEALAGLEDSTPLTPTDGAAAGDAAAPSATGAAASTLESILQPKGLEKFDPQGIGLKLAGGALKGVAKTILANQRRGFQPERRLRLSPETRRGPRFSIGR